jgi:hypothetical protein
MNRPTLLLLLAATVFTSSASAEDTTVYRTKNADGTTSYSQTQTDGAEERIVHSSGASTAVVRDVPAEAAAPDEVQGGSAEMAAGRKAACDSAIANLAAFESGGSVGRQEADGTTVPLTAEEAVAARTAAEQQKAANCAAGTAL